MFGRATIRLGIGPYSSLFVFTFVLLGATFIPLFFGLLSLLSVLCAK